MRQAALNAALPRRHVHTTQREGEYRTTSNLLNRDFTANAPNPKWLVDITAIGTDEGWLSLAGVLDVFSRRIVGGAMDEQLPDELTHAALDMAILQRQPPPERLHHADQASHYPSHQYQA
jgi:transposase InsO family protein